MSKKRKMRISFSPPDITESEIQAVAEVLRSGWLTRGPKTKLLEEKTAKFLQTEKVVCLNSQTSCAEMTLRLADIGEGDEVITTAYTYTATASVIEHVGAKIILADTQKDCLEMDYDLLESLINEKTKAIIPVDLAGIPCDYDRIIKISKSAESKFRANSFIQEAIGRPIIIADSAHAFGSLFHGKPLGSFADFTSFSWHAVKNFTTGEGGALTWRPLSGITSEDIHERLHLLSLHGQDKTSLEKVSEGSWEYDILGTWYKCNMTDIAAAIGLAQLPRYKGMLERRRHAIEVYDRAFKPMGLRLLEHFTANYESCGHLYMTWVLGITLQQRDKIISEMFERGVPCNVHYKPLPMHTAYKKLGFRIEDFPNAYANFINEISLPLHSKLTDEEISYVIDTYKDVLKPYI